MEDNQAENDIALAAQESIEELTPEQVQQLAEQSQPFVGQWNNLISTTNWEKGEIICQWRAKLREEGAASTAWSDERWSQMVGGVTPQHVGRLRRTHERFGHVYQEFKGIYWSHFYAALDWEDAEMWLEGSIQNSWSVSQMRKERWETMGKITDRPNPNDIVVVEADEETHSLAIAETEPRRAKDGEYPEGPNYDEGPDFGDEQASRSDASPAVVDDFSPAEATALKTEPVRPFEAFTDLPKDVSEAADMFKISIIRHRADEWNEISREDMLGLLDAMKQLVMAD